MQPSHKVDMRPAACHGLAFPNAHRLIGIGMQLQTPNKKPGLADQPFLAWAAL
jgi:hypothetical protein